MLSVESFQRATINSLSNCRLNIGDDGWKSLPIRRRIPVNENEKIGRLRATCRGLAY